jgi:hypothetical protein
MGFRAATSPQADAIALTPLGRRRHYRHQLQSLAYVNLDQANGGIIRNLGDAGMAIQALSPLYVNQQVFLRFDLANPRVRLETNGRVTWTDPMGQAGIEFLNLATRPKRTLKEWILIQLLASAHHYAGAANFFQDRDDQDTAELLFSPVSRPAIRLHSKTNARRSSDEQPDLLQVPGFPFVISALAVSRLIDGLIVLSAVLFFAVICLTIIGTAPVWPVALAMGAGIAVIFSVLYRFLFLFWIGCTPGDWMVGRTGGAFNCGEIRAEEQPRFR